MGVDLGLQGLDLGALRGLLLQIGALELLLHLGGHVVKMLKERVKLGVGGVTCDLVAPLAGLDSGVGIRQGLHRLGHVPAPQQPQQQKQRNHHQRRPDRGHDQRGVFPPGVILHLRHAQGERVPVRRRVIAVAALCRLPLRKASEPVIAEAEPVKLKQHVFGLAEGGKGREIGAGIEHHHDGGVGLEVAVQQVAGQIQLPVDKQKADFRVFVPHGGDHALRRAAAFLDQSGAAFSGAEGVDAVDLLVPEDQKHRPVYAGAGEVVP